MKEQNNYAFIDSNSIVPNKRYSSLIRKFSGFIVNIQLFKKKIKK